MNNSLRKSELKNVNNTHAFHQFLGFHCPQHPYFDADHFEADQAAGFLFFAHLFLLSKTILPFQVFLMRLDNCLEFC